MSWTTTQQQQPQYWAPTGWSGSWPPTAPAGYPGPPPIPTGVNPQAWTSGRWQINPMFRGPVPQASQAGIPAWAPHPSWGPQAASAYAAAAANYNPYKRQPNPGGRDYWNTKLSDNPLGLENMHIRETEHKKTSENGVMHTPWVWVPKELCESPENPGSTDVPSGRDGNEGTEGREGRGGSRAQGSHMPSREPSRSRHERSAPSVDASRYPPTSYGSSASTSATSGQSRTQERPDPRRHDSTTVRSPREASRTRTEEPNVVPPPPPNMPNGYVSAYSTYSQQHQRRDVSPRPADAAQPRSPPKPPTSSASAAATSVPSALEAFSSKQQLHPTFSPSIVRTPKHYTSASINTPTRRATTDDSQSASTQARRASGEPPSQSTTPSRRLSGDDTRYSTPTPPARRSTHEDFHNTTVSPGHYQHGPIYAPVSTTSASTTPSRSNSISKTPSRSNSLPKRRSSAPTPASGSPTSDAPPLPFLASFSQEPEGLLSPLITAPRGLAGGPSPRESPTSRGASSGREVGRSATYPSLSASSTFESIPEDHAMPQARTPKPQDRDRNRYSDPEATPYAGVRSPPRSSHTSPEGAPQKIARSATYPILDERQPAAHTSSLSPSMHNHAQSSYVSSRSPSTQPSPSYAPTQPSPSRASSPSRSHNPLPRPPMPSSYPTTVSSASASAYSSVPSTTTTLSSAYSVAPTPQPVNRSPARKVRKGYWNRRGDHLVYDQNRWCIVYAPREQANPSELGQYPAPTEGFMDHHGNKAKYDPSVPELPVSLPSHGEPPKRPYEEVCFPVFVGLAVHSFLGLHLVCAICSCLRYHFTGSREGRWTSSVPSKLQSLCSLYPNLV
ncbi:hypothetical protein C8Q72DRAFT_773879 [Fomitopsis betulina]|nr:hypothetical protein C8Q72DRAFT_773879 [Fomitopsis betulina]